MLATIPAWRLVEWRTFEELDPPQSVRQDNGFAHIIKTLRRSPKPLKDFLLLFGDDKESSVPQSLKYQEMLIDSWIGASNQVLKKKGIK